jgi:phenylacetate-coenzyme A ligase PaaK-like adenylate-forming protein
MPLLRYEVNDVVEVEEPAAACRCGRAMPRIVRVNGRHEDVITTPDGRVIPTLFIVFDNVPGVSLGQVVQEEPARLVIRIVPSEEYTARSETVLVAHVRRFVGFAMRVEVEYLSAAALRATTVGKFRTVISRVPSQGITTARPTESANAFPGVM